MVVKGVDVRREDILFSRCASARRPLLERDVLSDRSHSGRVRPLCSFSRGPVLVDLGGLMPGITKIVRLAF